MIVKRTANRDEVDPSKTKQRDTRSVKVKKARVLAKDVVDRGVTSRNLYARVLVAASMVFSSSSFFASACFVLYSRVSCLLVLYHHSLLSSRGLSRIALHCRSPRYPKPEAREFLAKKLRRVARRASSSLLCSCHGCSLLRARARGVDRVGKRGPGQTTRFVRTWPAISDAGGRNLVGFFFTLLGFSPSLASRSCSRLADSQFNRPSCHAPCHPLASTSLPKSAPCVSSLALRDLSRKLTLERVLARPVRHESSLPHLPVPTLEETAQRYLASIRPYHTPQEPTSSTSPLPTWSASEAAVKEFVSSPLVKELQERLVKRAEGRDSWLSEWWNETAYFGWRGPVVPGVSLLARAACPPPHGSTS